VLFEGQSLGGNVHEEHNEDGAENVRKIDNNLDF